MEKQSFFGRDIQYKYAGFDEGHRDFTVNLLANKIISCLVNYVGKNNVIDNHALLETRSPDSPILKYYHGFVISRDRSNYKLYLNAFLPILAASYSMCEKILTEDEYKEVMDYRWGLNYDYGHPLNSEMFVFAMPVENPLNKHEVAKTSYSIRADFYDPCGGSFRNYERDGGFLREEYSLKEKTPPGINILISYAYLIDILRLDPNNIPNGYDVNLPIFYLSRDGYTNAITPFHFEKYIIEAIQNNELIPYSDYASVMEGIKEKISEFSV